MLGEMVLEMALEKVLSLVGELAMLQVHTLVHLYYDFLLEDLQLKDQLHLHVLVYHQ
jgi:hypothetical protein